jgi:D-3-phosphoglycerate dehydrogenase
MAKVLAYGALAPAAAAILAKRADIDTVTIAGGDIALLHREVAEAEAVIARYLPFDRETIARAKRLKVVARYGVGYDNIDIQALTERGIPLATVGEANAVTVSEHALFMMLALAKQGIAYDRASRTGGWDRRESLATFELWRKTLLIVGFGRVGSRVAERCLAFGMRVLVYDPYIPQSDVEARGAVPVADLDAAIPEADIVTLHTPATPETKNLIDGPRLQRFRSSALLINTARGSLVDEAALVAALQADKLGGAGVDVYAVEPPATDHPLSTAPRTVLSPHSAGLTVECAARMGDVCAENALAAIDGRLDPAYVVNPEVLTRT